MSFHFKRSEVQAAAKKGNIFSFLSVSMILPCTCERSCMATKEQSQNQTKVLDERFMVRLYSACLCCAL